MASPPTSATSATKAKSAPSLTSPFFPSPPDATASATLSTAEKTTTPLHRVAQTRHSGPNRRRPCHPHRRRHQIPPHQAHATLRHHRSPQPSRLATLRLAITFTRSVILSEDAPKGRASESKDPFIAQIRCQLCHCFPTSPRLCVSMVTAVFDFYLILLRALRASVVNTPLMPCSPITLHLRPALYNLPHEP